jgi:hypothetical protein
VSRHGAVVDRFDPGFGEHPQGIDLAGRFDHPRQHQIAKHLITTGGLVEAEHPVGTAQRFPQWGRLGGHDLQGFAVHSDGVQPEIQCPLALGQPLTGRGLERLDLAVVMG